MARKKIEKSKGGRPTIMTPEVLGKLEQAFKIGANDREACLHAGINPDTLYEYQKKNPAYTEQKSDWKRNPILKAKYTIYQNLDDPNVAKWLLERRDDEYSNKQKQEITGNLAVSPTALNIVPVQSNSEH